MTTENTQKNDCHNCAHRQTAYNEAPCAQCAKDTNGALSNWETVQMMPEPEPIAVPSSPELAALQSKLNDCDARLKDALERRDSWKDTAVSVSRQVCDLTAALKKAKNKKIKALKKAISLLA